MVCRNSVIFESVAAPGEMPSAALRSLCSGTAREQGRSEESPPKVGAKSRFHWRNSRRIVDPGVRYAPPWWKERRSADRLALQYRALCAVLLTSVPRQLALGQALARAKRALGAGQPMVLRLLGL